MIKRLKRRDGTVSVITPLAGYVPTEFIDADIDDFPSDIKERVAGYVLGELPIMMIMGNIGSGKTRLSWAIARELLLNNAGQRPVMIRHGRLVAELNTRIWKELLHEIESAPTLIVDDFSIRLQEGQGTSIFADTVSLRRDARMKTIFTTNFTPAQINEWSEHLASRILTQHVIVLTGEDRRLRNERI